MGNDGFGQTTTLQTCAAQRAWDKTQLAFLAHGADTPLHLADTLTAEPEFALGHAVKGLFYLLLGRRELTITAQEALRTAQDLAAHGSISWRERKFIEALDSYSANHLGQAVHHLEEVLRAHPDDPLAMKFSHAIRFVLGDSAGMRRSIERVLPSYAPDHRARGYALGCHAFALEETGAYTQAQLAGRQALWTAPDDAWGLHAVAHVYDMTCDAAGGLTWLAGREAAWAHCNNFRYHVWWHKALMHLDLGEIDAVLALYDDKIRAEQTDDYRDISNGASLLSRLELEGIDVGDRWEEMAEISATRTEDGCLIFADLHYLLALIGGHREEAIATLMARMHRDAQGANTDVTHRMANPGVHAAEGLHAFGEGDYATAFAHMQAARPAMQRAGGSHAQRDVFERITIDAGLRAGRLDAAEHLLNERQGLRAGQEDGYTAARRALIASARDAAGHSHLIPAQ